MNGWNEPVCDVFMQRLVIACQSCFSLVAMYALTLFFSVLLSYIDTQHSLCIR